MLSLVATNLDLGVQGEKGGALVSLQTSFSSPSSVDITFPSGGRCGVEKALQSLSVSLFLFCMGGRVWVRKKGTMLSFRFLLILHLTFILYHHPQNTFGRGRWRDMHSWSTGWGKRGMSGVTVGSLLPIPICSPSPSSGHERYSIFRLLERCAVCILMF